MGKRSHMLRLHHMPHDGDNKWIFHPWARLNDFLSFQRPLWRRSYNPKRVEDAWALVALSGSSDFESEPDWECLDLSANQSLLESGEEGSKKLSTLLQSCMREEQLRIEWTGLKSPGSLASLARGLRALQGEPAWRHLHLGSNVELLASDEACGELLTILKLCPKLERLYMASQGLSTSGLATLITQGLFCDATACHPSLKALTLVAGEVHDVADYTAHLLEAPSPHITHLLTAVHQPFLAFETWMVVKQTWYCLDLSDEGMARWGRALLSPTCTVQELSMDSRSGKLLEALYPAESRPLAPHNTSVTRLMCIEGTQSYNWARAIEHLTAIVASSKTVIELHVGFDNRPLVPFIRALRNNHRIEKLYLSSDSKEHIRALLVVLDGNLTLREVKHWSVHFGFSEFSKSIEMKLEENARKRERAFFRAMTQVEPKCARLFLCGNPLSGKTTLCKAMMDCVKGKGLMDKPVRKINRLQKKLASKLQGRQKDIARTRTRGVEVHTLFHDQDMRVTIWDLAGQQEFYALHDLIFPSGNPAYKFVFLFNLFDCVIINPVSAPSKKKLVDCETFKTKLRGDLRYWLLFVASISDSSTNMPPEILVVLTHLDKVGTQQHLLRIWTRDVLEPLKQEFVDVVDVSLHTHVVNAASYKRVQPLVQHLRDSCHDMLSNKLPANVPEPCADLIDRLEGWRQKNPLQPIMRLKDFRSFQMTEIKIRMLMTNLQGDELEEKLQLISTYLHDVGEIIAFKDLDFVVVNPNWFGQGILGHLIKFGDDDILGTSETGLVSKDSLTSLLEHSIARHKTGGLQLQGICTDDLVQLMKKFELCYDSISGAGFFVPATLPAQGDSVQGTRKLEWSGDEEDNASLYTGRRLQCADPTRTFLTPGLFPTLQVHLHNVCQSKALSSTGNVIYALRKDLIIITGDNMEIFVELGCGNRFMDVLVKSKRSNVDTMEFVRGQLVDNILRFSASARRRRTLVQAIIRPECVKQLTICAHREEHAILLDTLKKELNASSDFPNYTHTWKPGEGLRMASDSALSLLGFVDSKEVFSERLANLQDVAMDLKKVSDEDSSGELQSENGELQSGNGELQSVNDEGLECPEPKSEEDTLLIAIKKVQKTVEEGVKDIKSEMKDIKSEMKDMKEELLKALNEESEQIKALSALVLDQVGGKMERLIGLQSQQGRLRVPQLLYFVEEQGTVRRLLAGVMPGKVQAARMHYMCERRESPGPHIVQNQPGYPLQLDDGKAAKLRPYIEGGIRCMLILVKLGVPVAASFGIPVPAGFASLLASFPSALQRLPDAAEGDERISTAKPGTTDLNKAASEAELHLLKLLEKVDIGEHFLLHGVRYLDAQGSKRPVRGFLCQSCLSRGTVKGTVEVW